MFHTATLVELLQLVPPTLTAHSHIAGRQVHGVLPVRQQRLDDRCLVTHREPKDSWNPDTEAMPLLLLALNRGHIPEHVHSLVVGGVRRVRRHQLIGNLVGGGTKLIGPLIRCIPRPLDNGS